MKPQNMRENTILRHIDTLIEKDNLFLKFNHSNNQMYICEKKVG